MAGEMAREVVERGPLSEPYTAYAPDGVRLPFWCIDGIGNSRPSGPRTCSRCCYHVALCTISPGTTWWTYGRFLPGGGMLDRAWRPKPVYRRIERILAEAGKIPPRPS
jgi:hypothetical protein